MDHILLAVGALLTFTSRTLKCPTALFLDSLTLDNYFFFFFWLPVFSHHYYKISGRNNLRKEGFICLSFRDFSPSSQVRYGGKSLQASCFLAEQNTKGNTGTRGSYKHQRPPLVGSLHHQGPISQKLYDLPTEHNYLETKHSDT